MSNLINNIKSKVAEKHISIAALERKAGLKRGAIWSIVTGKSKNPKQSTLEKISSAFGCSLEELLGVSKDYYEDSRKKELDWDQKIFLDCVATIDDLLTERKIAYKANDVFEMSKILYEHSIEFGCVDKRIANLIINNNF